MRKKIKESTIRKIIRKELLKESDDEKENKSQFDNYFKKALELTSNLQFDKSTVTFLQQVLHLFIVAISENKSSDGSKLGESSSNLNKLAQKVIESCPCEKSRIKLVISSLNTALSSTKTSKKNKRE